MAKSMIQRRDFFIVSGGGLCALGCGRNPIPAPTSSASTREVPIASSVEPHATSAGTQSGAVEPAPPRFFVYLQPLGETLPAEDLAFVEKALVVFYPVQVQGLEAQPLPAAAFYAPRQRYRAEKLLDFLAAHAPEDSHVIMGLTAVDISTTKGEHQDWGILGLASVGGGECVISRFRAQRGAKSEEHTRIRLAKTVVHEVGHTLGLAHCPNYGCLMEDGKGSVFTTDHEYDLCDRCRGLLGDSVLPRDLDAIPWPRPS